MCNLQSLCRAILVVGAALASSISPTATAGELRWRSNRAAIEESQSAAVSARLDPQVEPASGAEEPAEPRSVVTHRDDAYDVFRSAQLPETPDASDDSQAPGEVQNPFAPMPDALPPLDAPEPEGLDFDTPAPPDEGTLQLDQNQSQPIQGQPGLPAPLDTTMPPGPLPERIPTPSVGTMEAERQKSEEACTQGLSDLEAKTIDTLNLSIAVTGDEGSDYPFECTLEGAGWHEGRSWEETVYLWKASALCHKPLYFEDEHLERYGHSWPPCCQPLVSGAHFFTRLPILPYCMGIEPPNECIYALGHYRPGSCAPYMCNPVPFSWRGALFQAGAVVGAAAVLP
jgi:hypothetical protein